MFFACIFLIKFPNALETFEKDYLHKEKQDNKTKETVENLKNKIPTNVKIILVTLVLSSLVILIFFISKDSKTYQSYEKKKLQQAEKNKISFVSNPISKKDFEKEAKSATEIELEKLKQNPKYQKMLEEKGTNKENWVWQTREKEKKDVWREEEESNSEGLDSI